MVCLRWRVWFELGNSCCQQPGASYDCDQWGDDLGLSSVRTIDVGPSVPEETFQRMKRVFSEAEVRRGSGGRLPYHLHFMPPTR